MFCRRYTDVFRITPGPHSPVQDEVSPGIEVTMRPVGEVCPNADRTASSASGIALFIFIIE
jgi:hypothetical protein